jgi:hypothetical protein
VKPLESVKRISHGFAPAPVMRVFWHSDWPEIQATLKEGLLESSLVCVRRGGGPHWVRWRSISRRRRSRWWFGLGGQRLG